MRIVVQRVNEASVKINNSIHSQIENGLLVLAGFEHDDTENDVDWISNKLLNLRIFNDEQGVMNKSVLELGAEILIVSQFTLHASTKKGNRPSYIKAARPEQSIPLYNYFVRNCAKHVKSSTGVFGADMKISLTNDGPVTILIDSKIKE